MPSWPYHPKRNPRSRRRGLTHPVFLSTNRTPGNKSLKRPLGAMPTP